MDVNYNRAHPKKMLLSEIPVGRAFRFLGGKVGWMKTDSAGGVNAVHLEQGTLHDISLSVEVVLLDAEVVVKGDLP